jgi:hypothetical protein
MLLPVARLAITAIVLGLIGTHARPVQAQNATCSQQCLLSALATFKADVLARRPVTLAQGAEVRENMALTTVAASSWKDVKAVKSSAVFADALTGNVVSRDGVELADGRPGYLSTRLKIAGTAIREVELSSDVARANAAYVWSLPSVLTAVLPVTQRSTRQELEALAQRYFQSLTDHKAVKADFDDGRCNRFHSGNQITNVAANTVEGEGARTCITSVDGPKPWGPALEQRFPIIDVERGIVLGITRLMYANQVMYVSEIFKVETGRIVHIDNIGIVRPGLNYTTGFGTKK